VNDTELRALVRDAVARHFQTGRAPEAASVAGHAHHTVLTAGPAARNPQHASHGQYLTVINVGDACVIEPAVNCDHCGYCKSHGH
jgi:hypothetical protein